MFKKSFLSGLLLLYTFMAFAASQTIKGTLIDSKTKETLPFASVRIEKAGLGTVSNTDGLWSIKVPETAVNATITFSFLGYTTRSIPVTVLPKDGIIALEPSTYELQQIIVNPDKQYGILRKAWEAIKDNYPVRPTKTQGFYRETEQFNDTLFLYFNEAVLNVYKNTYSNHLNFGQIEVEKSRKNVFPGIDSINDIRFYGGPHFPNDLDIVFSRWDFINPSSFKNWRYELEGTYRDSLSYVYVITFKHKRTPQSNYQGRIYIDGNNYAYIGFELKLAGAGYLSDENIRTDVPYIRGNTTIDIGYIPKNGIYFLNHISYQTNGINTVSKKRVFKEIEFITTTIQTDSVKPIPFNKQFDYTDILSIEADDYEQSFWKDYTILQENRQQTAQTQMTLNEAQALEQLTKTYNTENSTEQTWLQFLKRFKFEGGFSYIPCPYQGGLYLIDYGHNPLLQNPQPENISVSKGTFGLTTNDGLRYDLSKQLSLTGYISTSLYGFDFLQTGLGVNYRTSLFPSGRWIFMDVGLGLNYQTARYTLGNWKTTDGQLQVKNKWLKSDELEVKTGQSIFGASPTLGLAFRMGKQAEIFTECHYLLPLIENQFIQFKETEGFFLTRKSARANWEDPDLFVNIFNPSNNQYVRASALKLAPVYFRIGIRSGF